MQPPLHQACLPLVPLLGLWRGSGNGHYPTIDSFEYSEEIVFAHVGKPFVTYTQKPKEFLMVNRFTLSKAFCELSTAPSWKW